MRCLSAGELCGLSDQCDFDVPDDMDAGAILHRQLT